MPFYEYECEVCGLQFEGRAKMADPNPPCPRFIGLGMKNPHWEKWFRDAEKAFENGKQVQFPGTGQWVGPDFEHTVIPWVDDGDLDPPGESVTKTLAEWIEEADRCGGETKKLISKTTFHLKGGGWAKDGY